MHDQLHSAPCKERRDSRSEHLAERVQEIQGQLWQIHRHMHAWRQTLLSRCQCPDLTQRPDTCTGALIIHGELQTVQNRVASHRLRACQIQVVRENTTTFRRVQQRECAHTSEEITDDVGGVDLAKEADSLLAQPRIPVNTTEIKTELQAIL